MKSLSRRGILTFEWILLISLLVIGIIGGLSAVRNSLLTELNDLDECIQALNTSGVGAGGSGSVVLPEAAGAETAWYEPTSEY